MPFKSYNLASQRSGRGFTLAEVVVTVAVLGIVIMGLVNGYVFSARRAEWSANSLAAHSLAIQGVEQARSAQWDTGLNIDELPAPTNYIRTEVLDIPSLGGPTQFATNIISITTISTNPTLREIRADCVWRFMGRGSRLYTNSVVSYRAPD